MPRFDQNHLYVIENHKYLVTRNIQQEKQPWNKLRKVEYYYAQPVRILFEISFYHVIFKLYFRRVPKSFESSLPNQIRYQLDYRTD